MSNSAAAHQQHRINSAANRLGLIGFALLLLACLALSTATYRQLLDLRQQSNATRAQLLAKSVALRINHALAVGIPLQNLQGVQEFLRHRLNAQPDIQSISLQLDDGTVLARVQKKETRKTATATAEDARADIAINAGSHPLATVHLQLQPLNPLTFVETVARLLAPVVILLSTLAYLAARFSEAQGLQLRNFATRLAMRSIRNGRYDRSFAINQRKEFDLRVHTLGHATRNVHETLVRVRRLITSLRVTEPQLVRRERLDHLLRRAEDSDQFAEHGLLQIRIVSAHAQTFWACLLIATSSVALASLAAHLLPANAAAAFLPYGLGLFAASACAGASWAKYLHWRAIAVALVSCMTLIALATFLAFDLLESLPVQTVNVLVNMVCGLAAGMAFHACQQVQQQPQQSATSMVTAPIWPAAAMGAWANAVTWLAPALANSTHASLGFHIGAMALGLPAVCCLWSLLLWNEPRSPWRLMPGKSAPLRISIVSPLMFAACAVGLMVGTASAETSGSLNFLINSGLGIGLFIGLFTRALSRRRIAWVLTLSGVLWMLDALLSEHTLLHSLSAPLAGAGLGFSVGCLLRAHTKRTAVAPLQFLIPVAIGTLVGASAIVFGLPDQDLALTGVALIGAGLWSLGRADPPAAQVAQQSADHAT